MHIFEAVTIIKIAHLYLSLPKVSSCLFEILWSTPSPYNCWFAFCHYKLVDFCKGLYDGIIKYTFFIWGEGVWRLSLNTIIFRCIYIVMYINNSFLFILESYSIVGMTYVLYSPVHGHLSFLQFGALTSKLLSTFVFRYLCGHIFSFLLDKYLRINVCQTAWKSSAVS